MRRPRARLALATAGAALAVAMLLASGAGSLATPPLGPWTAVTEWYERVGAGAAALTGVRLVALVVAGWILVASVLQLAGTWSPGGAVRSLADAVSPRALRRAAHGVAGLSVAVALAGPPAPTDPAGTAVMEVLEEAEPATTTTVPAPAPAPAPVPTPAGPRPDEVVVAPGDSFWSLAVDTVADRPGPRRVDAYWRRLVAANRSRLVDPTNPDLLYPGQVLTLPPPEG